MLTQRPDLSQVTHMRLRLFLVVLVLCGCAPRGEIIVDPAAASVGVMRNVFVGTTRAIDPATGGLGNERLRGTTAFARYDVSIPPDREVGKLTWPRRNSPPDPQTDFLTTDAVIYGDTAGFRQDLRAALAAEPRGQRDAVVFVHGFNTTFAEGLYRIAQLSVDLDLPGVPVHYAWPSLGTPLGYVYDRDSAIFARDGLERLLDEVAASGAERIVVVAHSMGSFVAMETLRQMAIRGNSPARTKLAGVVLISPDLDVDVFHEQAAGIGKLPQPFIIFTSRRDRALALSARLTGQRDRLGNLANLDEVADLELTVVDVAAFSVGAGHFNVGNSPALIQLLGRFGEVTRAYDADQAVRAGLVPGVVLTVRDATAVILSPVTVISGAGRI